jgi:hypothetical protein
MQALPTQIKWVRDGLLIVGLNTEMQVYSQWTSLTTNKQKQSSSTSNLNSKQKLLEKEIISTNNTNTGGNGKTAKTSLVVPKNHSVLDLKKLNKLTNLKTNISVSASAAVQQVENEHDLIRKKSTAVFDDSQMLELIQDSGIFMQAKYLIEF